MYKKVERMYKKSSITYHPALSISRLMANLVSSGPHLWIILKLIPNVILSLFYSGGS